MGVRIRSHQDIAYGLDNALQSLSPQPIVSNRAPGSKDSAPLGTIWINKAENAFFVLTSVVAGVANWEAQESGTFATLTVTGNASIGGNTVMTGDLTVNGALGISVLGVFILAGAGSPNGTVTAPQGSLYLNTTGSSGITRAFINSNGGTDWVAVETAS